MGFVDKTLFWLKTASDLGQLYLMSRRPHIEENLPEDLADREWMVLATREPVGDDPVYATPAYKAVKPGGRFWVFVEEGEYWLYAVRSADGQEALKQFYAEPTSATELAGPVVSEPGFRADVEAELSERPSS